MDKIELFFLSAFITAIVLAMICFFIGIGDMVWKIPIADEAANKHCRQMGFDQYKSYSRVGVWSIKPIAIKCEYAEKFTNLGVYAN